MIVDLGLSDEIAPLRPTPISPHSFNYDPFIDGSMIQTLIDGKEIIAPIGTSKIVKGKLFSQKEK
jgi:hypothetical protein